MKTDTKNKYIERLSTCIRLVMRGIEEEQSEGSPDSPRMERLRALFAEVQRVQNQLLDGLFLNAIDASNAIQGIELKVKKATTPDSPDPSPADAPDVPNWNNTATIPEDAPDIVKGVADAQRRLLDVYESIVTKSPLAAHVPAVMELQVLARSLTVTMQGLAKVGALL